MGSRLRSISRQAHPEAWAERTRFRRIRRLTQQAMRAKGSGNVGAVARIVNKLKQAGILTRDMVEAAGETAAPAIAEPTTIQKLKGKLLSPFGGAKKDVANEDD